MFKKVYLGDKLVKVVFLGNEKIKYNPNENNLINFQINSSTDIFNCLQNFDCHTDFNTQDKE